MAKFPNLDPALRLARLAPPAGRVPVLLDTDTYNEIDDQFAVVYSLLSPEQIDLKAICAAPFHNNRSSGPGDGMERSYEEILRLLDRLDVSPEGLVFKGSDRFLPDASTPVRSPAVDRLIELAMAQPDDDPLYVLPVGAITNIASALMVEPRLVEKIVVVWLGGNPTYWPSAREFNLYQDTPASRLIFDCGVPLIHLPCRNATEMLRTTRAEMKLYVKGQGPIGDYLYEIFTDYVGHRPARSKVLWDIAAPAWVIGGLDFMRADLVSSPILTSELTWSVDRSRHLVREMVTIDRDKVYGDLFRKLEQAAQK